VSVESECLQQATASKRWRTGKMCTDLVLLELQNAPGLGGMGGDCAPLRREEIDVRHRSPRTVPIETAVEDMKEGAL